MSTTGDRGLSTARAVLHVLALVAERPEGMSAVDVARELHKSRSTAYHLLASLEAEGYVARDGRSGRHQLIVGKPGAPSPAHASPARLDPALETALTTAMHELFARTHRRTSVGVLSDRGLQPLAEAGRQGIPRMGNLEKPCILRTAHALAIGKVALAALGRAELERHLATFELAPFTPDTIIDHARLRAELDTVRSSGIAVDRCEYDSAFASVAGTVTGRDGRPAAALSVTVTRTQFLAERELLEREVSCAAAALGRRLAPDAEALV